MVVVRPEYQAQSYDVKLVSFVVLGVSPDSFACCLKFGEWSLSISRECFP
jgi:hypothetical protein